MSKEHLPLPSAIDESEKLLKAAWGRNGSGVARGLDESRIKLTSPLSCNNEQPLQSAIRLAFICADALYAVIMEYHSGKGYAAFRMSLISRRWSWN